MDELLTVSSTRRLGAPDDSLVKTEHSKEINKTRSPEIDSPEGVLRVLQSKPDLENLVSCLKWLKRSEKASNGFRIRIPSPKAAPLINALVNDILPDYWNLLRTESGHDRERSLFVYALTSLAGIGALATRLRNLTTASKSGTSKLPNQAEQDEPIKDVLEVLEAMFKANSTIRLIANDLIQKIEKPVQKSLALKELISWIASGRLVSIAAEADATLNEKKPLKDRSWLCDGKVYSRWLGQSIQQFNTEDDQYHDDLVKIREQLLSKALFMGYRDQVIEVIFEPLFRGDVSYLPRLKELLEKLPKHEQRDVIYAFLRIVPTRADGKEAETIVSTISALLREFDSMVSKSTDILADWLVNRNSGSVNQDLIVHRAVVTALSLSLDVLGQTASRLLSFYSDILYIEHMPILHQEMLTQDLLLVIGQLYSCDREQFKAFASSGPYINSISNRLSASSPRSHFLGMVVGMAVSELADDPGKRMNFGVDEVDSEDGKWYRSLIKVNDRVGSVADLKIFDQEKSGPGHPAVGVKGIKIQVPIRSKPIQPQTSKIVAIEELDDSESNEDDLPTYEKPDSDREDSDEDPTLIQRNKATAPVYIRDLIAGLGDSENYDRNRMALYAASDLIRRKAKFGTEVSDHAEELAAQLAGLKDSFNIDRFEEKRLQAMISMIVAQPLQISKWYSIHLFIGDYSMSQRASILTALSMAARDLAGYREQDAPLTGAHTDPKDLFPSKRLPSRMDPAFAAESAPVSTLTNRMEEAMIKPMAAAAADKFTGPDVLKVRTFSSRMEVEKKRKRPITNELAKIVADGFFFPLTGRFRAHIQAYGSRSSFSTPFLLSHLLKTLALIMSASGQSTLSLPALTAEFWDFLLPLRPEAAKAKPVLEAILFCFLTILEINSNDLRSIAQDHSQELLETQSWAQKVFDNERAGEKEGEKVRMLAASVMVKCAEVVEKYQQLLLGDLVNFS